MKERPIIFNTEMVKAILEGRKTVTRRPVMHGHVFKGRDTNFSFKWDRKNPAHPTEKELLSCCPFGQIGDRLYVRETALYWYKLDESINRLVRDSVAAFKADGYQLEEGEKWEPSIHMPKKYARIWLEITDIRVERVQDITIDDLEKEGLKVEPKDSEGPWDFYSRIEKIFKNLWDSIYGDSNYCDANPWIWVVEFKRIEK